DEEAGAAFEARSVLGDGDGAGRHRLPAVGVPGRVPDGRGLALLPLAGRDDGDLRPHLVRGARGHSRCPVVADSARGSGARSEVMSKRITIDPITRIEGHLRIDCEVGADNKVSAAWA